MTDKRQFHLALLMLGALAVAGCNDGTDADPATSVEVARPAKIQAVQSSGIAAVRSFPGTLDAAQKSELAFRVGGELVELPARPGMQVRKGDMIARLDDAEYKNIFDETEARYGLARIQYDQARKLVKQKLGSQLQMDQAEAEMKMAKAAMEVARDNLGYTRLLAPFDGVIAQVSVENHQAVEPKAPIIQLQNEKRLEVTVSVPESTITRLIRVDDPEILRQFCGAVRFTNLPGKSYKACFKEHESVPDPLTRNYEATFTLEPVTDIAVLPGMSVDMELDFSPFLADDEIQGVLVPVEAVFDEGGREWIWRVDKDMRARRTEVSTGVFVGDMTEITDGLSPGDQIIAAGVSYLREGMLVRPLTRERGL